jgi:hypothetical protein
MPKRSSKKPKERDMNVLAWQIVQQATGQAPPKPELTPEQAAAALLGRRGGLKGGKARAAKLSKKRRSAIAKKAAEARWRERD